MFLRFVADRAHIVLFTQHVLIPLAVNTGFGPFALLQVMRVAQTFGVYMAVARLDSTRLSRRLAVAVARVAVP